MVHTNIVAVFIALVFVGCVGPKSLELEQERVRKNCAWVSAEWDSIAIGSDLLTQVNGDASRLITRTIRFSSDERAERLLRQLKEPSYMRFPGANASLKEGTFGDKRISELTREEQRILRELWVRTLSSIFVSDAFEADAHLLEQAVEGGELHVSYVLVGRYNTAETGHVDGAKIVVTNPEGIVITKLRKSKVLLYPYRFIDTVAKTDKYLF